MSERWLAGVLLGTIRIVTHFHCEVTPTVSITHALVRCRACLLPPCCRANPSYENENSEGLRLLLRQPHGLSAGKKAGTAQNMDGRLRTVGSTKTYIAPSGVQGLSAAPMRIVLFDVMCHVVLNVVRNCFGWNCSLNPESGRDSSGCGNFFTKTATTFAQTQFFRSAAGDIPAHSRR